jgi:hypothetical protein
MNTDKAFLNQVCERIIGCDPGLEQLTGIGLPEKK